MSEKISGEFHHAECIEDSVRGAIYQFRRNSDGHVEGELMFRYDGYDHTRVTTQLRTLDEQARHWIEHTQAQNQGLREAAGDLLAQLKSCGAESEKIANLAAALSNNPQVSEPCPTCGGKGTVPSGVNPVVTVDCPECRPVVQVSEGSEAAALLADINDRLENCFTLWEWEDENGVSHYCYSEECPFEFIPGAPRGGHGDPPPEWMIPERRSPSPLAAILQATTDEDEPPTPLAIALSEQSEGGGS